MFVVLSAMEGGAAIELPEAKLWTAGGESCRRNAGRKAEPEKMLSGPY